MMSASGAVGSEQPKANANGTTAKTRMSGNTRVWLCRVTSRSVEERDRQSRDGVGRQDVVVRRPRNDRKTSGRAAGAVETGIPLPPAQEPPHFHDVRRRHRVGVGEDQ